MDRYACKIKYVKFVENAPSLRITVMLSPTSLGKTLGSQACKMRPTGAVRATVELHILGGSETVTRRRHNSVRQIPTGRRFLTHISLVHSKPRRNKVGKEPGRGMLLFTLLFALLAGGGGVNSEQSCEDNINAKSG